MPSDISDRFTKRLHDFETGGKVDDLVALFSEDAELGDLTRSQPFTAAEERRSFGRRGVFVSRRGNGNREPAIKIHRCGVSPGGRYPLRAFQEAGYRAPAKAARTRAPVSRTGAGTR